MLDDLPSDVMVRILLNLPVKDVIRSTLLHISIYSLVHSKFFIDTYNHHSLLYQINPPLIIFQHYPRPYQPQISMRYNNAGLDEYMPLCFPFHDQLYPSQFFIGNCCNSLVSVFGYCFDERLFLWNPCIQKTLTLPNPKHKLDNLGFLGLGFVSETSDYKLLIVDGRHQAELYSLQHNSWKIIAHPGSVISYWESWGLNDPVYLKGSLYWITIISDKYVMGVFDFKDEVFSDISLPDGSFWDSLSFLSVRVHSETSIAVVHYGVGGSIFHIQVMDVDSKKWIKYSTVESRSPFFHVTDILGFNQGDEIVRVRWREYNSEIREGTTYAVTERIGIHRNGKLINVIEQAPHADAEVSSNYVCNLELLDIGGE